MTTPLRPRVTPGPTVIDTPAPHTAPSTDTGRRTRLAVLTDAVFPWHTGGKEMRQHEMFGRLVRRGIDVDVYTMQWWDTPGEMVRDGVTYHSICPLIPLYTGERRSIFQAVAFSVAGLRMMTRDFDVLEADMVPVLQLFPAKLVTLLRRKRLVVTWHEFWGRDYWVDYLGLLGHLAATLEQLAVHLPDEILAASEGTRRRLLDAGCLSPARVRAVPNGIDLDSLTTELDGATGAVQADVVVAGRLLAHKNVDVALRALRVLHDEGQPLSMAVIGQGPEAERLAALAHELGLDDAVTFTGVLPEHAGVLASMRQAQVVLFPSAREGFGMVALEAMAVGTPVVTSDAPDNFARDIVTTGVNGVVTAARPRELAHAVRTVLGDRAALSEGARRTAADFDWDTLADAAAEVYGR